LDWVPREGEWPAPLIFAHLILARHHGPIMTPEAMARIGGPVNCRANDGIKGELRASWDMLARFLSDSAKLDATYDGRGVDLYYNDDPEDYTGHYIPYHRFVHDLHHRSTIIGYLAQLGVSLDSHRIRPL
jgi:uncharacterized damage-inducible protein DinB